jgi:predicted RNA-binding protein Jag
MSSKTFTGRNVEAAVQKAADALGIPASDVQYTVMAGQGGGFALIKVGGGSAPAGAMVEKISGGGAATGPASRQSVPSAPPARSARSAPSAAETAAVAAIVVVAAATVAATAEAVAATVAATAEAIAAVGVGAKTVAATTVAAAIVARGAARARRTWRCPSRRTARPRC